MGITTGNRPQKTDYPLKKQLYVKIVIWQCIFYREASEFSRIPISDLPKDLKKKKMQHEILIFLGIGGMRIFQVCSSPDKP